MTLLTAIEPTARRPLEDAVRAIAWSSTGRTLTLGADGRALLTTSGTTSAPMGPDPIDCCWITADRFAVVDGMRGVIIASGSSIDHVPIDAALLVRSPDRPSAAANMRPSYCVVVGGAGFSVVYSESEGVRPATTIDTGPLRTAVHLGGAIWLCGGADGLVVVDIDLDCIDERIEMPGVVALAAATAVGRVVAADSTGSIHVLELSDLSVGSELAGYPDPVRRLGITPLGDTIVACIDDELSWWSVDESGSIDDRPEFSTGHDTSITCCEIGATGLVATGDANGVVRLWSPHLRDVPVSTLLLDGEITVLAWNPEGERLAIGTGAGDLVIADVTAGSLM